LSLCIRPVKSKPCAITVAVHASGCLFGKKKISREKRIGRQGGIYDWFFLQQFVFYIKICGIEFNRSKSWLLYGFACRA
jgi:hypothetical protein